MFSITAWFARWRDREEQLESKHGFTLPRWIKAPISSFNFMFFHYLYIVIFTIVGSVMIFPAGGPPDGGLKYIDALFFAAGAATQSGLNSIDVNLLNTYQQIVLIFMSCLCNPITINTFVVFVRLYWFEKKFRHIIMEAQTFRRNRSISRVPTIHRADTHGNNHGRDDSHRLEGGVGNSNANPASGRISTPISPVSPTSPGSGQNENGNITPATAHAGFRRDIVFADEILPQRRVPTRDRVPEVRPIEHHIAFAENQRTRDQRGNSEILRIPSPREVESGKRPELLDSDSRDALERHDSEEERDDLALEEAELKAAVPEEQGRSRRLSNFRFPTAVSIGSFVRTLSKGREDMVPQPYLSYTATIGRNSEFVGLTELQKEELGGIEFRSLKTLRTILIAYNVFFTVFGIVVFVPWIVRSKDFGDVVRADGQSVVWWGIFTPTSMFTDLGFTLTPDSMISFQKAAVPLLIGGLLIVVGNTGFPCMLRFLIWVGSKIVPFGSGIWEELMFLLDHPRRCFTLLFPRTETWYLLFILILLNGIDLVFFVILDLHDSVVTSLPGIFQFIDGLFQAISTRTAGTACVNLADLHPGIQVSYLVMMYISVFPIAISVRSTNTYEELSLGVYSTTASGEEEEDDGEGDGSARSYVGNHLRRQLSFDLWFLFLGLFLVCVIEGDRIQDPNQPAFTIFACLFEIVSAYGTVGLSLGYPNTNASFSSQFGTLSKLIIVAMMIRGRHRGLPYALDRAILLPGEGLKSDKARKQSVAAEAELKEKEKEHEQKKAQRRGSRSSVMPPRERLLNIVAGVLSAGPAPKSKKM